MARQVDALSRRRREGEIPARPDFLLIRPEAMDARAAPSRYFPHVESLVESVAVRRSARFCAAIRFEHPTAHRLVQMLPPVINVNSWQSPEMEWINSTLRFISAEARERRAGGDTVITRLADVLVIQAIRSWLAQAPVARTGVEAHA
jgi:hypothetical protein